MLRDSVVVVVVVVRTRPRAIPLAMITIRKSFMGFLFFPVMTMGLRLAALRAAGAPLIYRGSFSRCRVAIVMVALKVHCHDITAPINSRIGL